MLLDEVMPRYDVVERHATAVRASPAVVYAAIREADLIAGPVTRPLLALRALPAAIPAVLRSPRDALLEWRDRRARQGSRLADLESFGFRLVAERAPEELVIGALGRFWMPRSRLCAEVSAADFADGPPRGFALAGWNFMVTPRADGRTELRTETRVWCAPDVRRRFGAYWLVIRPWSGLIRHAMLREIRLRAEQRQ